MGKTSARRILLEEGINPRPQPDRSGRHDFQPWDQFLKLHLNTLLACDFFCKNVWTPLGKRQAYFLQFIHVSTRKVWVSPATYHPDGDWVLQQSRNLLMWLGEMGLEATHLIHDRDTKFTAAFDELLNFAVINTLSRYGRRTPTRLRNRGSPRSSENAWSILPASACGTRIISCKLLRAFTTIIDRTKGKATEHSIQ